MTDATNATALERKLERALKKISKLEHLVEDKTRDLYEANEDLSNANGFMTLVLESMAGAFAVTDQNFQVRTVNKRLLGLLGYERAEVVGQPVCRFFPQAGQLPTTGESGLAEVETQLVSKDGASIPVACTTSRLPEAEGGGCIYVAIDIRERKAQQEALDAVQKDLVIASRHAGMAEVATGVLHNVGNILNTVNVTAHLLASQVGACRIDTLDRLAGVLESHQEDLVGFVSSHPQGPKLPGFVRQLSDNLAAQHQTLREQVEALTHHLDHAKTIVAAQQSVAGMGGVHETTTLESVLDETVAMLQVPLEQAGVKIVRDYQPCPALSIDRHRLQQIAVNLVQNAVQACEGQAENRAITLTTKKDGESLQLSVKDTGKGIAPEHFSELFRYGFTTRADGHGFGLHGSANAATELGGRLTCHSDGPGTGATFSLTVPVHS